MEQNRKNFWTNSGNVSEEMNEYWRLLESAEDAEWSVGDEWFSLFCCQFILLRFMAEVFNFRQLLWNDFCGSKSV